MAIGDRDASAGTRPPIAPDGAGLARSRIEFLASDAEPPAVRPAILASWRRSRQMHVAADRIEMPYVSDVDADGQLNRTAEPVLRDLREKLEGQSISIVLVDQTGLVLSRRTGDKDLERHLDSVLLAPGFNYAERFVGTNGIGTALESGGPTAVFGHEHYAENLEDLACAGVPIHHPVSGRTVGAIDLTCWRKDAESLLLTLAKTTADQIQQALLGDSGQQELELFRAYRRTCHRINGIVFALTEDAVMLNDRARAVLQPADQAALVTRAAESTDDGKPTSSRSKSIEMILPTGTTARMYCQPVHVGAQLVGVVAHVRLDEADAAEPASRPAGPAMSLPGLLGNSPLWLRACREVEASLRGGGWLAVEGEAGVGKHALLRAAHVRRPAFGRLLVVDAADAIGTAAARRWAADFTRAVSADVGMVVVRHADRLDNVGARLLAAALVQARAARPALRAVVTVAPDWQTRPAAALAHLFPQSVEVPPLRMRLEDVEHLVPFLLGKHGDGARLTCSPEAMRLLQRASWPGNVGQLEHLVQQVVAHRRVGVVVPEDLPPDVRAISRRLLSPLESMERDAIVNSLADAKGDKIKAARALGMSRATIYRRIHDYGILTTTDGSTPTSRAGGPAKGSGPKPAGRPSRQRREER